MNGAFPELRKRSNVMAATKKKTDEVAYDKEFIDDEVDGPSNTPKKLRGNNIVSSNASSISGITEPDLVSLNSNGEISTVASSIVPFSASMDCPYCKQTVIVVSEDAASGDFDCSKYDPEEDIPK